MSTPKTRELLDQDSAPQSPILPASVGPLYGGWYLPSLMGSILEAGTPLVNSAKVVI